jgi:hypothetical protein
MSIKVMSKVWDGYPAGGSELLALLALADWSNDDGMCFPSIASIASKTRLSRSQAQRVVHALIDQGFVAVLDNAMGGAPGATRRYRINLAKLATGSAGATGRMDATPTGRTDATGSAGATGRMDARDGSHGCAETGRMGATLTVIEPSITTKGGASQARRPTTPRQKREQTTLNEYLFVCKTTAAKPVPDDHPIRKWCVDAGLVPEMLQVAWVLFRERYTEGEKGRGKRYKDWPGHFANAVKANWFRLWFADEKGALCWTSTGLTHKTVLDARMTQREGAHAAA